MNKKLQVGIAGLIVGIVAVLLVKMGNPANMGFCIACFLRDTAGAISLHTAPVVRYIRPEIIGLVFGAFLVAVFTKEFKPRGGSSPMTRFLIAIGVMIGALVFLGCPLRLMLRLAGGDLNAIVGLVGFVVGIAFGAFFLNKGFNLKRTYKLSNLEGATLPLVQVGMLGLLLAMPAFIVFSTEGPGSKHAPIFVALAIGLLVGIIAQRTRLCTMGGIRDMIMFKDFTLAIGFVGVILGAAVLNAAFGFIKVGFAEQPIAHADGLWNFLGMFVVGWGSVLLGGCPLRQLILAGEGNADSGVTVMGLMVGAAIAHNFGLAASPKGVPANAQIATLIVIALLLLISLANSELLGSKK